MLKFPFLKKNKPKRDLEPQEVFLDQKASFEVPLSQRTLKFFLGLFLIVLFTFFVKTFYLQVFEKEEFVIKAAQNKFIFHSVKAQRGIIYDSSGEQLVFNNSSFDLFLDKTKLPSNKEQEEKILREVSGIIKKDYHFFEKLEEKSAVLENLDHQTLILLEAKIKDLPGFEIRHNSIRYYPQGQTFAHLLGYIGKKEFDYVGKEGLERYYQDVLTKKAGKIQIERDAFGNIISEETISFPESGESLVLWLDAGLQRKTEEELKKALERTGAQKAAAVALNPKTGGVLTLVSLPGFDNNLFGKGTDQELLRQVLEDPQNPLFNRAISGLYPTGSVIKPLIAAAALEEEIISPLKEINCQGEITTPHRYNPDIIYHHKDWRVHGPTDMRKAIAESCNVYFYTIGGGYKEQKGLGPTNIKKYLELFGWGEETKIDLPGENKGFIPFPEWKEKKKKESWWDGDTYNLSIGQGDVSVTPLQVAFSFAAIANGGTLYKPKIVKQIIDSQKNLVEEINPEVLRKNFINPKNLQIVREGMRRAVTGQNAPFASSVLLNSLTVEAAAKTGTAQTSSSDYYHNWITVFAPYDNPQIVLTIIVESVKGVTVAALPAAKEILQYYFTE